MEKLAALRAQMKERGLDAYLIVSGDAHSSEYVADHWRVREWFSGFTGSNGTVVVTLSEAGLWTDGRYFIQAAKELDGTGITLYKSGEPNVPDYKKFLGEKLPEEGRLGFDGRTIDATEFHGIKRALANKKIAFAYQEDVVGNLWAARPPMPTGMAFAHEPRFAGIEDKLQMVREKMKERDFTSYLIVALDDIAWLTNMRGSDVPNTPVVYAYALVTDKDAHLFIDQAKVANIADKLKSQGFTIHDYHALTAKLRTMPRTGTMLFNGKKTNVLLSEAIPLGLKIMRKMDSDIIPKLKSVKSETEIANTKNAYIKDSIVIIKTLIWIEDSLKQNKTITECDISAYLAELRKSQEHCLGDSFNTIAAYGENAALMHYRPENGGATIKQEGLLLIDTGGQYLDGTTDTTRTIPVGAITEEMINDFTLVLKGHINLAQAKFLKGTTGHALDVLARQPLWQECQNYKCGTGHGIGYCLGVHEGPQNIAQKLNTIELAPGMLVTNEPGVYKEGRYGIRTENVLLVEKHAEAEDGIFLKFTPLTYVPISQSALNVELLTSQEKSYLNDYHKSVLETLSPLLSETEVEWLKNATKEI